MKEKKKEKHGSRRRAQKHMVKKTQPEKNNRPVKASKTLFVNGGAADNMAIRLRATTPASESTSLKFGCVKKMFYIYSSVSPDGPSRRIPDISAWPTVSSSREARCREAAPSTCLCIFFVFPFFSPPPSCYCRSTLTSRPCHGSMLAFLFLTSRDCIAAQLGGTGPVPPSWLAGRRGGSP